MSGCQIKNEVFEKEIALFCLFYVGEQNKKNQMEKAKKNYKMQFLKVVIKKWEKKEGHRLFAKDAKHYLCLEGRETGIFVHTICFGKFSAGRNSQNQETL